LWIYALEITKIAKSGTKELHLTGRESSGCFVGLGHDIAQHIYHELVDRAKARPFDYLTQPLVERSWNLKCYPIATHTLFVVYLTSNGKATLSIGLTGSPVGSMMHVLFLEYIRRER